MHREVMCPRCGMMVPLDADDPSPAGNGSFDVAHTVETVVPGTICVDDLGFELNDRPSVFLATPPAVGDLGLFPAGGDQPSEFIPEPPPADTPDAAEAAAPFGSPPPVDEAPEPGLADAVLPATSFPHAIDLTLPTSTGTSTTSQSHDLSGEGSFEPSRASSWMLVIVGSYASALTLAFVWLWASGRLSRHDVVAETIPSDSRPELGPRGPRAPQIPDDRITTPGQSLRVGSMEITPLEIRDEPITLERTTAEGPPETREGGPGTLVMKLRLRNVGDRETFPPLDPAFLREPDRGLPDSFIETEKGEKILIYPLAVESEWSIVGQSFPELKPGATLETLVVCEKEAAARAGPAMIWRLLLRVESDKTAIIGVRFGVDDLKH